MASLNIQSSFACVCCVVGKKYVWESPSSVLNPLKINSHPMCVRIIEKLSIDWFLCWAASFSGQTGWWNKKWNVYFHVISHTLTHSLPLAFSICLSLSLFLAGPTFSFVVLCLLLLLCEKYKNYNFIITWKCAICCAAHYFLWIDFNQFEYWNVPFKWLHFTELAYSAVQCVRHIQFNFENWIKNMAHNT